MDVFLMIRRKKTTIFLDAKESSTVLDLKKMIEGITKKSPADQQLYNKDDTGNIIKIWFMDQHTYIISKKNGLD